MNYNDWFLNVEPALHMWSKSYLVIICNSFNTLLDCILLRIFASHEKYWYVVFLSWIIFFCIWYWPHRMRKVLSISIFQKRLWIWQCKHMYLVFSCCGSWLIINSISLIAMGQFKLFPLVCILVVWVFKELAHFS